MLKLIRCEGDRKTILLEPMGDGWKVTYKLGIKIHSYKTPKLTIDGCLLEATHQKHVFLIKGHVYWEGESLFITKDPVISKGTV